MRARTWGIIAAVVLTAGTMLVGCPAFHDDYPGTTCKVDTDCYQGEMCTSGTCTAILPPGDMAMKMFNFDFAMPDLLKCDDDAGACPDLSGGGDM
jgi:hypothetical protein